MFSSEEMLDFDDEEFAKVALDLEAIASSQSQTAHNPGKRKSFELEPGVGSDKPVFQSNNGSNNIIGEPNPTRAFSLNRNPESCGPPFKRRSFEMGPTFSESSKVITKPAACSSPSSNMDRSRHHSDLVIHNRPIVVEKVSFSPMSTVGKELPIKQNKLPVPKSLGTDHSIDFDLDDLDLDLSLDDPTTWTPKIGDVRTANPVTNTNLNNPQSSTAKTNNVSMMDVSPRTHNTTIANSGTSSLRKSISTHPVIDHDINKNRALQQVIVTQSSLVSSVPTRQNSLTSNNSTVLSENSGHTPRYSTLTSGIIATPVLETAQTLGTPRPGQMVPVGENYITSPVNSNKMLTTSSDWSLSSETMNSAKSAKKRKRKFPGPAGLLPKLKPGMSLEDVKLNSPATPNSSKNKSKTEEAEPDLLCSQSSEDVFSDVPWRTMKKELDKRALPLLEAFNISSILRKASLKQLPRGKVPVTCVLIDQLQVHTADASAILRDVSGQMKGTIHRQLMKDYPTQIIPGTVLVLRQVGVFSPSVRNHYLNITPSNLAYLYYKDTTSSLHKLTLGQLNEEDFKIPSIQQLNRTVSDSRMDLRPQSPTALRPLRPNVGPSPVRTMPQNSPMSRGLNHATNSNVNQHPSRASISGPSNNSTSQYKPHLPQPNQRIQGNHGNISLNMAPTYPIATTITSPSSTHVSSNSPQPLKFTFRKSPSNSPSPTISHHMRQPLSVMQPQPGTSSSNNGSKTIAPTRETTSVVGAKKDFVTNLKSVASKEATLDNADLWGDDHLDDLLTGLEDEMLLDF